MLLSSSLSSNLLLPGIGLGGVEIAAVVVVGFVAVAVTIFLPSSTSSSSSSSSSSIASKETSASFSTEKEEVDEEALLIVGEGSPNASSSTSLLLSSSLMKEEEEKDSQTGKFEDASVVTVSGLVYVAASMTRAHRNSLAHAFLAFTFISSPSSLSSPFLLFILLECKL